MSDARTGPDPGTTWDEALDVWDEVREIVTAWIDGQPEG